MLCEDEVEDGVTHGAAPIVDLTSSDGTLARRNSSAEVWKLSDEVTVVSRASEASLLPRLVTWRKSEDIAQNILDFIESEMHKCPDAESQPFCFRSRGLVEITKLSKDLRQNVPGILDVEVDPNGGPRVQEAAMKLYAEKDGFERIHLVQGLQAIEMGVKRFYYSYKQLLTVVMGSLEAGDSSDSLDQVCRSFTLLELYTSKSSRDDVLRELQYGPSYGNITETHALRFKCSDILQLISISYSVLSNSDLTESAMTAHEIHKVN
nr:nematode resistance protein-like HSPRO2 [Ipomoea batatas]